MSTDGQENATFEAKNTNPHTLIPRPDHHNLTPISLFFLQEMQSKMDALRRELDDQRDKDGGVFISEEKKSEMEEKVAQLEKLRKEHANLTVRVEGANERRF